MKKPNLAPAALTPADKNPLVVIPKSREECFEKLIISLKAIFDNLVPASQLLVHLLDMDLKEGRTNTYEQILKAVPGLAPELLHRLELVGRGKAHHQLIASGTSSANLVLRGGLKMKYQKLLCEGPGLAVAVPSPSDEKAFLVQYKTKDQMKLDEVRRAVDPKNGEWRTPEKQWELYLAEKSAKKTAKSRRWKVIGDKIKVFQANQLFTFSDLIAMAKSIEPTVGDLEKALRKNQIGK